jgi:ribosome-binding factor A
MPSRRQEKMSRLVKEAVSEVIQNRLSDPRIEGFISITRVIMPGDLRSAEVYISILGENEATQRTTFKAIEHAKSRIQSLVAGKLRVKFSPVLHFHHDKDFKKSMETIRLIEEITDKDREQ